LCQTAGGAPERFGLITLGLGLGALRLILG